MTVGEGCNNKYSTWISVPSVLLRHATFFVAVVLISILLWILEIPQILVSLSLGICVPEVLTYYACFFCLCRHCPLVASLLALLLLFCALCIAWNYVLLHCLPFSAGIRARGKYRYLCRNSKLLSALRQSLPMAREYNLIPKVHIFCKWFCCHCCHLRLRTCCVAV